MGADPAHAPASAPLQLPLKFGRFVLHEVLGEGGMGAVFAAEMSGPKGFFKPCALKVMHPSVAVAARRMGVDLKCEARLGALLHHPGIVEVYDFGLTFGQPWMAMELVDGTELSDLLAGAGPLPLTAALDLGTQVAAALHHAHTLTVRGARVEVVHRDLKPSNLLVGRDGRVRIADFGVAKAAVLNSLATRTGITKGTPSYMSPEQASAAPVDARSALFSLAVILYQCVTGRRLFCAGNAAATIVEVLKVDELIRRRGIIDDLEARLAGLGRVLATALSRKPDGRQPTAAHLGDALEDLELRAGIGPTLAEWVDALPDQGTYFRGIRAERRRKAGKSGPPKFDPAEHLVGVMRLDDTGPPPSIPDDVILDTWPPPPPSATGISAIAGPAERRRPPALGSVLVLALVLVLVLVLDLDLGLDREQPPGPEIAAPVFAPVPQPLVAHDPDDPLTIRVLEGAIAGGELLIREGDDWVPHPLRPTHSGRWTATPDVAGTYDYRYVLLGADGETLFELPGGRHRP